MSTSSRTDCMRNFFRNREAVREDHTREHITALRLEETKKLNLAKAEGANCYSYLYHSVKKYTHCCCKPEKSLKQVNPLSICATYVKEFIKS